MKNSKPFKTPLCLVLVLNVLCSCGYRWQPDSLRPTVSIPFIRGDEDGTMTNEVIHALSASGVADVVMKNGDYRIEIAVQKSENENIGYRVDKQKVDGKVRKNILPIEARRSLTVEVNVYKKEELVHGPFILQADADYDYIDGDSLQDLTFENSSNELVTILPFSLGQLEPVESAQEAATKPLYSRIALKIVDMIRGAL